MIKKIAALATTVSLLSLGVSANAAGSIVNEPFDTAGTPASPWVVSGTGGFTPIVITDGTQTPASALRLTEDAEGQSGFVLYDRALSSYDGLDISFHQAQWGGDGADGISLFIKKGTDSSTTPGEPGGGLGYLNLSGALLGIGLDAWGNFASVDVDGTGCSTRYVRSTSPGANAITLRGPGNAGAGYCLLADSYGVVTNSLDPIANDYQNRADADRLIRVVIDPSDIADPRVQVYYDGTKAIDVPLPAEFKGVKNIKFGFTAGTGGSVDNHEVWGLTVAKSPNASKPRLTLADTGTTSYQLEVIALLVLAAGAGLLIARRRIATK